MNVTNDRDCNDSYVDVMGESLLSVNNNTSTIDESARPT